jgi:hypothetical protein
LEAACPRLAERGHGSWYFHCSVTTLWGKRERVRRGGYLSRNDAEAACKELLRQSREERTAQAWTVARWLRCWLSAPTGIRPTTLRSYTEHVERHLIPHLGRIRLAELTGRDVAGMFAALAAADTRYGRPPTPSTLHRIRATLRSALNAAAREGLLPDNPARFVELPAPRRPTPRCGPIIESPPDASVGSARRWRCGPPGSLWPSSASSGKTGSTRCGG